MNANLLTPHIANASRPHDARGVASIRDVAHRDGRRRMVAIKAIKISRKRRLPVAVRVEA
jgi:hypothetical protein